MEYVQILMPMGGLGSRFSSAGYTTPKPLIEVDGRPMFMKALESFNAIKNKKYIFVIRKDQDIKYNLASKILNIIPNANISVLDKDTRGAVESCMYAEDHIENDKPLIVADCDIYFESSEYFNKIQNINKSIDAILLCFNSNDPRYSFAKIDRGRVIKTAEKVVISNNAILGGYYFKNGKLFKDLSKQFLSTSLPKDLKEYYISHLFNILINNGGRIEIAKTDIKHIFGTPEELKTYLSGK